MKSQQRILALSATALIATGSVTFAYAHSNATAAGDESLSSALAKAPDTLQTPFEKSDGAAWTTYDESVRFHSNLDKASERVAVKNIGISTQGRKVQQLTVGHPAPKGVRDAKKSSTAMLVCSIHGDEPSGRESCMKVARNLAFSKDPATTRFLKKTTVVMLFANPDGWVANTRTNAAGSDLNRDYLAGEQPETQAVLKSIRDWKPDILNDLHEYGPRTDYDTDLLHLWPRNRNVDPKVYKHAKTMSNKYASELVTSKGYTSGVYGQLVRDGEPYLQVAGDSQARILRNYAGLVNVVGMLSETANAALTPEEEKDPKVLNTRRVDVNQQSAVGSLQLVQEKRVPLMRATAGAEQRQTDKGAKQGGVVYFEGQDDMIPTNASKVDATPMCGYKLTTTQFAEVKNTLALHGISSKKSGADRIVTMAQPLRGLIPMLLDGRYEYKVIAATPVDQC